MDQLELMKEAARRGILPPDKQALYDEAVKRGLIDASASEQPVERGALLPVTRDADGLHFDLNSGITGSLKRVFTAPHDVMTGALDPMSPEGMSRAMESALWMTPAGPGTRATGVGAATKRVKPPTAEELLRVGGRQIEAAKKADVVYRSDAIAQWAANLKAQLERDFHPSLASKSYDLLDSLITGAKPGTVMEMRGLTAARENFQAVAQTFNKDAARDQAVASRIIKALDDFVARPPNGSVLAGPAVGAGKTYAKGRANYAAGKRSQGINAREASAELQAAVANAGRGSGNRLRAAAKWYVDPLHPERLSGFNALEKQLLEQVAEGTATRNTARYVGNLLGGGGGLGGLVTGAISGGAVGSAAGSPGVGAAAGVLGPAVGFAARSLDNKLTSAALRKADEAVRSRSPLYTHRAANAPATMLTPQQRAALSSTAGRAGAVPMLPQPPVGLPPPPRRPMTEEEYRAWLAAGNS